MQPQRLTQFIWLTGAAVLASTVTSAIAGDWPIVALLAGTAALLLLPLHLLRRKRHDLAATVVLSTLTLTVAGLVFFSNGLRDEAVMAIPGVLVLASLFGPPRYFAIVLGSLCTVLVATTLGNVQGWHVNPVVAGDSTTLFNLLGILGATAYLIWRMASDLRDALTRLEIENENMRRSHARIDALAHHDALTGLPNRLLARDRFEQAIALARRRNESVALLFLDLDNFKAVNDSLGHSMGDMLLCDVAARLLGVLRASDTVSRQGGDEFLIVMGGVADREAVTSTAAKIVDRLSMPFRVEDMEVSATCSVGIAVFPEDGHDFDTLLKHADMAMYRAKDTGRNAFRFYDTEMSDDVVDTLRLLSGIRNALGKGEFRLHYQPQFELSTGRIVGAEALLRWWHPEQGYIPPNRFIPIAERSGLINELGMWVLREACAQARRWQDEGLGELVVAVNLSSVQFRRDDFEREVVRTIEAAQIAPDRIELELTESLLIAESPQLTALLGRFRAMGMRLTIDDFGTGYSNLGYLKRFNVERLKIDKSFIRRLLRDSSDESIVRAIIEMSHSLMIAVTAEGIEDAPTLQRLIALGCDYGQGFLWSPALPPEEFTEFVGAHQLVG